MAYYKALKNKYKLIFTAFIVIFSIAVATPCKAQDIDGLATTYNKSMALFNTIKQEVKLFFKENTLVAESIDEREMLILNDKANGAYNKYRVYHGSFDELKNLEAYTKVPENGKYKKIKVEEFKVQNAQSNSVFYDDVKETVFDFPAIIKGSICHVTSTTFNKDIHLLTPHYFNSYLPVLSNTFSIEFPNSVKLNYIIKNDEAKTINVETITKGRTTKLIFSSTNVEEKDYYSNAPSRSYTDAHVIFYVTEYITPNNENVTVFKTQKDFYNWSVGFLKDVNKTPSEDLKNLADSLAKPFTKQEDKAKAIFTWVQKNIKYVAFEDGLEGFIPRQAVDVCNKRYGDCKDMSSLSTTLLQLAGLDAHLTWIGTRSIAYDYDEVFLPITDNHMITTVKLNNEWFFLDATDPNCIFGMPTSGIQGKQALISIDPTKYEVVRVPTINYNTNSIIDSTFIQLTPTGVKGNTVVYYKGYCGSDNYNILQNRSSEQIKDFVKSRVGKASNKFILGDYNISPLTHPEKELNIKADFEIPGYGKKIADEYYINLNMERMHLNRQIDTVKRKLAVEYEYAFATKVYTILQIPEGFEASYIPNNYNAENNNYAISLTYTKLSNKIILEEKFLSKTLYFMPKDFSLWNNDLVHLTNSYKEQIVLKKK